MIFPIDREERADQSRISGDRRAARRYDIRLNVKWKLIRRRKTLDAGEGWTLNLSSGGMQIETGKPLPVGFQLNLSISWPVLLHNVSPLQLTVSGHIARSEGGLTAIRISTHEFRTVAVALDGRRPARAQAAVAAFEPLRGSVTMGRIQ
jgi:hypothetical protein